MRKHHRHRPLSSRGARTCGLAIAAAASACAAALFSGACSRAQEPSSGAGRNDASAAERSAQAEAYALAHDGGSPSDAAEPEGPMIAALFPHTPVMSDMDWPTPEAQRRPGEKDRSVRLGYIRQGGRVPVIPEAHPKANCPDGWYELLQGGFVCGKYATLDLNHPRVKLAPHPPFLDQPLPYQYGFNVTNGTPLYKTVPSHEDRLKFEPWLKPHARPRPADVDPNPYGPDVADNGGATGTTPASIALSAGGPAAGSPSDPFGAFDPWDSGVPWYLKEYDGGKPTQITLDDLREDSGGGPIVKRMVKGFYLALDKDVESGPHKMYKWWRTTGGLIAPFDRVVLARTITDFHGVWLGQEPSAEDLARQAELDAAPDAGISMTARPSHKIDFPVAFVLAKYGRAHKYTLSDDHKTATAGDYARRFTAVHLTGQEANAAGNHYLETDEGWWMRANEGVVAKPGPAPKDLRPGEKWIDVNLTTETLVAFEGDKPVYATLVSTGKMDDEEKEKDHRTKPGTFRIREKHIAATMDGDVATDGPYSIEDVPWIMYFNGSIALHGAFWHANFGHVQSHGCVNLAPLDAKAMFGWTDPQVPAGWHGVMATDDRLGTRVIVHDPPPDSHPKWLEPL